MSTPYLSFICIAGYDNQQGRSVLEACPEIQAEHDVFLRLFTPFTITIESVRAKRAGELKNTTGKGRCICYFEATGELCIWSYDELRAIAGASHRKL
jgi:hypothetical protein